MAAGPDETHALSSVTPGGELRWRYPAKVRGLDDRFGSGPTASVDGETL